MITFNAYSHWQSNSTRATLQKLHAAALLRTGITPVVGRPSSKLSRLRQRSLMLDITTTNVNVFACRLLLRSFMALVQFLYETVIQSIRYVLLFTSMTAFTFQASLAVGCNEKIVTSSSIYLSLKKDIMSLILSLIRDLCRPLFVNLGQFLPQVKEASFWLKYEDVSLFILCTYLLHVQAKKT